MKWIKLKANFKYEVNIKIGSIHWRDELDMHGMACHAHMDNQFGICTSWGFYKDLERMLKWGHHCCQPTRTSLIHSIKKSWPL